MTQTDAPLELFYSYAHEDRDLRNKLDRFLVMLKHQGLIKNWHDAEIEAGAEWDAEIKEHLNSAQIILLLVSNDFLASDYIYNVELKRAMERHSAGEARVIPVILRPCDWETSQFSRLKALPTDAKPVTTWDNWDEAFTDIVKGIRGAVTRMKKNRSPDS